MTLLDQLKPYLASRESEDLEWDIIERVDPCGVSALLVSDVPRQLRQFMSYPHFRTYWRQLNERALLEDVTAPAVAAILNWQRSQPDEDDVHGNLKALVEPLRQAAAQYDDTRSDLRAMRIAALVLAETVVGDTDLEANAGEDPGSHLLGIGHQLIAGFWSLLGLRRGDGRWCASFGQKGIVWADGPSLLAERGGLLLSSYHSGVPFFSFDAELARQFPARADGWAHLSPQRLFELAGAAQLQLDVSVEDVARQQFEAEDLPSRQVTEIDLGHAGLRELVIAPAQNTGGQTFGGAPVIPWLLRCDDGVVQGALGLAPGFPAQPAWATMPRAQEPSTTAAERRVLRYAGELIPDMQSYNAALRTLLVCACADLADSQSVAEHYEELPSVEELDAATPRARRRELRREREAGRGRRRLVLRADAPASWSGLRALQAQASTVTA